MITITYSTDPCDDVWAFVSIDNELVFSDCFTSERAAEMTVAILMTVLI